MSDITERVRDYLGNGGLFNPEHMNHDAVRDLIMDMDTKVRELEAKGATFEQILESLRGMTVASEADAKKIVG